MINEIILKKYLNFLRIEKRLSFRTFISYEYELKNYLEFSDKEFSQTKDIDIREYISLLSRRNLSGRSISKSISVIKNFFYFLIKEKVLSNNPCVNCELLVLLESKLSRIKGNFISATAFLNK